MADTPTDGAPVTDRGSAATDAADRNPETAGGRGSRRGGGGRNPVARGGRYVREVAAEMRKVVWPTRGELVTYTSVVLVFVTVMIALVFALDYLVGQAVLAVFG
jgi:preprotein translocase subunit SecE